jgi:hypothetical protein
LVTALRASLAAKALSRTAAAAAAAGRTLRSFGKNSSRAVHATPSAIRILRLVACRQS